jgi:hypothetical protein
MVRPLLLTLAVAALLWLPVATAGQGVLVVRDNTPIFVRPDGSGPAIGVVGKGRRLDQDTATAPLGWQAVMLNGRRGYVLRAALDMVPAAPLSAVARGMEDGERAADSASVTWPSVNGFVGGVTLGLVGALAVYLSVGDSIAVPLVAHDTVADYQVGFRQSYSQRLRERRRSSTLAAGIAGTLVGGLGWYLVLTR